MWWGGKGIKEGEYTEPDEREKTEINPCLGRGNNGGGGVPQEYKNPSGSP